MTPCRKLAFRLAFEAQYMIHPNFGVKNLHLRANRRLQTNFYRPLSKHPRHQYRQWRSTALSRCTENPAIGLRATRTRAILQDVSWDVGKNGHLPLFVLQAYPTSPALLPIPGILRELLHVRCVCPLYIYGTVSPLIVKLLASCCAVVAVFRFLVE
jgi:hypothetical protein